MVVFSLDSALHSTANANIKKPTEIAHFSYDDDHKLHPFSDQSLRYYHPAISPALNGPPNPPLDLSKGFNTFRAHSDTVDEHLDSLLDTLEQLERNTGVRCDAQVLTWRGMMTKILTAPFEFEDGFEMNATLFQGTMYAFIEDNYEAKVAQKRQQQQRQQRGRGPPPQMSEYWGYKFEVLSLLDKPLADCTRDEVENRDNVVVNNNAQYCSIIKTGMGSTSLILGGEVDGVLGYKPDDPNDPARWIELKTARPPETPRDHEIHDKKLMKFWAQSFLLGVPHIIIGYRSRDGHLLGLEELETRRIPTQCQNSGHYRWNGSVCIKTAAALLDFLKAVINGPGVWRIKRRPRVREVEVYRIQDFGTGDIIKKSFIAWRDELATR